MSSREHYAYITFGPVDPPWKADDREWFKANPGRSHRLRRCFSGETFGDSKPLAAPPPRHEFQVLVRQTEPGRRSRLPFCRNIDCSIPDVEPILHAMFDLYTGPGEEGEAISVREVAALAKKYVVKGQA